EPRRGPRAARGPGRGPAVPGPREGARGLAEPADGDDVRLRGSRDRRWRHVAFHGLEVFRHLREEAAVPVSLERLGDEPASRSEGLPGEREGGACEVQGAGEVEGPVAAELRGGVAEYGVRGTPESLQDRRVHVRIRE